MTEDFEGSTHIVAVLDKSGSMGLIRDETISGFNEWLGELWVSAPGAPMTLVLFDTVYTVLAAGVPVEAVRALDHSTYVPSGSTALYDAMSRACREAEGRVGPDDRALVAIVTDGQENSSRETTKRQAMELVEQLEGRGNWTFTYLSASPSAFADAAAIGVAGPNAQRFAPTPEGSKEAFRDLRLSADIFLESKLRQTKGFYDKRKGR